jgi:hypothetical protein
MLNPVTTGREALTQTSATFSLIVSLMALPALLLDPALLSSQIHAMSLFPQAPHTGGRTRSRGRAAGRACAQQGKASTSSSGAARPAGAEARVMGQAQAQVQAAAFLLSPACRHSLTFSLPSRARALSSFLHALSFLPPELPGDAFRAMAMPRRC